MQLGREIVREDQAQPLLLSTHPQLPVERANELATLTCRAQRKLSWQHEAQEQAPASKALISMHGKGSPSSSVVHFGRHSLSAFLPRLQAADPPSSSGAVAQYSILMQPLLLDWPKRISLTLCSAQAASGQRHLCGTGKPTAPSH